jgi:low temperature requirement protein LtrA
MLERICFRRWWKPPRATSDRPDERRVSYLELFYDLVYVVIIAELSHSLSEQIGLASIGTFVFLFIVVWWAWFIRNETSLTSEISGTHSPIMRCLKFTDLPDNKVYL